MGYFQEAYDAECAAIARALKEAANRSRRQELGWVRIFTDAQAAMTRMSHDEPRPGQTYAAHSRRGKRSRHCASRNQRSRSRSGGARHARASPAMKSRTNGRYRQPASRTNTASSGCGTWTELGDGPHQRRHWRTSGAGHRKRSGAFPLRAVLEQMLASLNLTLWRLGVECSTQGTVLSGSSLLELVEAGGKAFVATRHRRIRSIKITLSTTTYHSQCG